MSSKLKVLQVIPKLGYGGAETGCYDLAHFLGENDCLSCMIRHTIGHLVNRHLRLAGHHLHALKLDRWGLLLR